MDIQAKYRLEIAFLSDQERVIELIADGNPICEDIMIQKCARSLNYRVMLMPTDSLYWWPSLKKDQMPLFLRLNFIQQTGEL